MSPGNRFNPSVAAPSLTDCPPCSSLQSCTMVVQLPLELRTRNLSAAVTEVLAPHSGNVTFDGHVTRIGARKSSFAHDGKGTSCLTGHFLFFFLLTSPQRLVATPPATARWTTPPSGADSTWRLTPSAPQPSRITSPAGLCSSAVQKNEDAGFISITA